jgi:GLPGLI family protein
MKKIILLHIILLSAFGLKGQYTNQGKIEYEKKVNIKRVMDDMDEDDKRWLEKFSAQMPKFNTTYFDMYFTPTKTIYKPGRENDNNSKMWFANAPANENIVYTDFKTGIVKANKLVYEEKFLVQDSLRKMKWQIKDEIRTIANYKCRKAVGRICDSVVVVAFYTEDILATGGPEMFSGLPGMILELAIPRMYATWIATKVEITPPTEKDFVISEKGKKATQQEVYEKVKDTFTRWGKDSQRYIWWIMI